MPSLRNSLSLYQYEACPFCVKVRRGMKKLGLDIELRDAKDGKIEKELIEQGGQDQGPCLRIQKNDGSVQWMYESSDILEYLAKRFGS